MWQMCCKLPERRVRNQSCHTTIRDGVKSALQPPLQRPHTLLSYSHSGPHEPTTL